MEGVKVSDMMRSGGYGGQAVLTAEALNLTFHGSDWEQGTSEQWEWHEVSQNSSGALSLR